MPLNEQQSPRVVAWEVTRACPLACIHCRAEAQPAPDPHQLTTEEGFDLLASIAAMGGSTIVILTGGEPLTRPDIFDLARFGTEQGLRMVVSPDDGRLLTADTVARLREAGVQRVSFSLHYPTPEENDLFARTPGAFASALAGLANLHAGGLPFQINTTVTKRNVNELPRMLSLVSSLKPAAWDLFFLIPTGRAAQMGDGVMSADEYEESLHWLHDLRSRVEMPVKQTCAPQFRRIERQLAQPRGQTPRLPSRPDSLVHSEYSRRHSPSSRGCMCGNGFCFVSHVGEVQGCGYLPLSAGNVRQKSFTEIYRTSPLFTDLRDVTKLGGKCGYCEYRHICGGCRARAYATSGDYLGEEPYCPHLPGTRPS